MKVIRNGVFETNSSSSHSISIKRNTKGVYDTYLPLNNRGLFELTFGDNYNFGWGYATYNSLPAKLNYLACMAFETYSRLLRKNGRKPMTNYQEVMRIKDIVKLSKLMEKTIPGFRGFIVYSAVFGQYTYEGSDGSIYLTESIDHQSWEDYANIDEFLKSNKITIENFLFNPKVKLIITNDNI